MSFRTSTPYRFLQDCRRNYYFSSMSFRTGQPHIHDHMNRSQLLFQQYVLSDTNGIVRENAPRSQLLFQQYVLSDLMQGRFTTPFPSRNYYFSSMSFRTRDIHHVRTAWSRNYYFSSMSFRTAHAKISKKAVQVATTISAVCPFGLYTSHRTKET